MKHGVLAVMLNASEFPYTVRMVSEITEPNGSSSMTSVYGASLALMDAGRGIHQDGVADIAMGLVKEGNNFVVLSDILYVYSRRNGEGNQLAAGCYFRIRAAHSYH